VVGSERHVCNATERIIAVQGQFRVIDGGWFWCQWKARIWFPISNQQQPWFYLAPFRRYGGLLVEKSPKSLVRTHPGLRNRPRSGRPLWHFVMNQIFLETQALGWWRKHDASFLRFDTIPECDGRTDGQTGGHLCSGYTSACIACYANALVKIECTSNTPCLKKTVQTYFLSELCQNFVKFRPIVKIFDIKIAKRTSISEVYSFSTWPNLCQRTTVLNADAPNCYITL